MRTPIFLLLTMVLVVAACGDSDAGEMAIEIDVEADESMTGTFTAKGPAVDGGLVCTEGTFLGIDAFDDMVSRTSTWKGVYDCGDGSGTFTLDVATSFTPGETLFHNGEWTVLQGTGSYVDLSGSGATAVECQRQANPPCHEDSDGLVEMTN